MYYEAGEWWPTCMHLRIDENGEVHEEKFGDDDTYNIITKLLPQNSADYCAYLRRALGLNGSGPIFTTTDALDMLKLYKYAREHECSDDEIDFDRKDEDGWTSFEQDNFEKGSDFHAVIAEIKDVFCDEAGDVQAEALGL